ncbi:ROK family protein [Gimesia aquarii]|uniref:Glucokinase n=1 Tax=Gimesia aquarii TaxID=2527964 RepID=A0A517W052_9PLAN|nr:ROK family protein [Gimesia aquarii]QDT98626.1 Glucokinase [Gimesia aquarii]
MREAIAGVDLGGTSIKVALANCAGDLLCHASIPTEGHLGATNVLSRIAELLSQLSQKNAVSLKVLGMGVPGLVDVEQGITKFLPNLPSQWREVPVARQLGDLLSCQVRVVNDARAATLGELRFGHGRSCPDATLAFMTLGTGVGGGVAIEGQLRLGPLGAAGELGHQTILPEGPRCGCGNRGCLETLASGPAIASAGIRLMNSGQAPNLHQLVEGEASRVTVVEMAQVAQQDPLIHAALIDASTYIGIAAANVVTILHPDMVVLGGGVAEMGPLLIERVQSVIQERVGMFPTDHVQVLKSELGVKAGVIGAIATAKDAL